MFLTVLSMVGGGLFRLLPHVLSLWTDWSDKKHEIRMMQLQIQHSKEMLKAKAQMFDSVVDVEAHKNLYNSISEKKLPYKWSEVFKGLVRPVVTYTLVATYIASKIIAWTLFIDTNLPLFIIAEALFNHFDESVLGAVLGFWFVGRAIEKTSR